MRVDNGGSVNDSEHGRSWLGVVSARDAAVVPEVGPAVSFRVAVNDLVPHPRLRHAEAIVVPRHGREVADDESGWMVGRRADPSVHALISVVQHHPAEPVRLAVAQMKRRMVPICMIEVTDKALHALTFRIVEREPVETAVMVPFPLLRDLASHEQQLLAGMTPHEAVIRSKIGKALPFVTRHLADHRAFSINDLVV